MLLSIIIPVYNSAPYLQKCLDSIISQSFIDYEVLMIDDGSSDDSGDIIDSYSHKDSRFHAYHKTNEGVSAARNMGIDYALGSYIYFMDSDDYLVQTALEKMVQAIENDYDFVSFNFKIEDEKGHKISNSIYQDKEISLNSKDQLLKFLLRDYMTHKYGWEPWNRLYRRDIIEKNRLRFPPKLNLGEDFAFTLCYLFYVKKYKIISDTLYIYVQHQGSITNVLKDKYNLKKPLIQNSYILSYCNETLILNNWPPFFVKILDMEVSKLRRINLSHNRISKMLKAELSDREINLMKNYLHSRHFARLVGVNNYTRLQYYTKLYLNGGKRIYCIFEFILFKLFSKA